MTLQNWDGGSFFLVGDGHRKNRTKKKKKSFVVFLIPRYLPAGGGSAAPLFQLPVQHISRPQGWLIKQMCVGGEGEEENAAVAGIWI